MKWPKLHARSKVMALPDSLGEGSVVVAVNSSESEPDFARTNAFLIKAAVAAGIDGWISEIIVRESYSRRFFVVLRLIPGGVGRR